MNHKKAVRDFLEVEPRFRERKNKDSGIAKILTQEHSILYDVLKNTPMTMNVLVRILQDYATMDRAWRQALERNPNLRGKDYGDKQELVDKKLEELGYGAP